MEWIDKNAVSASLATAILVDSGPKGQEREN